MTELSKVQPDRDALVAQLEASLLTQDSWKDRVTSATGKTLVDFQAAIGAYSQFSIESAFQEAFPESAKNADSLYAASNFMGVRYNRKLPAQVTASITASTSTTLPAFSQFVINGSYWFTRTAITVGPVASPHFLYQGKIVDTTVTGIGTDFQAYVTPEKSFTVADYDVLIDVNGASITATQKGLWSFPAQSAAQNFTLPNGSAVILFGNDIFGSKPGVNDTVRIRYAVTFGADGNNLSVLGQQCSLVSDPTVKGTITTPATGGGNEADPFVYKNVTPALAGSFDAAVTPSQYKALPMQYPGVLDAQVYAQREINPKALTWMNNMKVVLLTASPFNGAQWDDFTAFMQGRTMFKCQFVRADPVGIPIDVSIDVYCSNFSNLTDIKAKVITAVTNLFAPRRGILGFDTYKSDLEYVTYHADNNVEYMVIKSPTTDIVLSSLNVLAPTLTRLNGGSLAAGSYDYGISVVSSFGGETAPANWTTAVTSVGSSSLKIDWLPVANAVNYKVWGRQSGVYGLLATLPASTLTFTDDGTVTPTGLVPVQSTIASYYPKLGNLTINCLYSQRSIRLDGNN